MLSHPLELQIMIICEGIPHCELAASEQYVGLPEGQMGNSDVGHLNIRAGRLVKQLLPPN